MYVYIYLHKYIYMYVCICIYIIYIQRYSRLIKQSYGINAWLKNLTYPKIWHEKSAVRGTGLSLESRQSYDTPWNPSKTITATLLYRIESASRTTNAISFPFFFFTVIKKYLFIFPHKYRNIRAPTRPFNCSKLK